MAPNETAAYRQQAGASISGARPRLAFLFDMDGVVIDSTALHVEAWRQYLEEHGVIIPNLQHRMLGKHNNALVHELFNGRHFTPAEVREHGARKEKMFRDLMRPVLLEHLVPGVAEFLARHSRVPAALATNAERANLEFILDGSGLRHRFQALLSGDEVASPKPDPEIYQKAAKLLGHEASACIVFEDSGTGVEAARAAGAQVVGVATSVPDLQDVDLRIRDFRDPELEAWLSPLLS